MSRAISRDSFNELKNYLGVYMQQGRVMLDADWNESQDITAAALRRLIREALGDGTPNDGFAVQPIVPPSSLTGAESAIPPISLAKRGHPVFFFLNHSGEALDGFESPVVTDYKVTAPGGGPAKGHVRSVEGRAYERRRFLRLSGHSGPVRVMKALGSAAEPRFATSDILTFRFRVNTPNAGSLKFVIQDSKGNETRWLNTNTAFAGDVWLPGFAFPLDVSQFRILTTHLPAAVVGREYHASVLAVSGAVGTNGLKWVGEGLPSDLNLSVAADTHLVDLQGLPTAAGVFKVILRVTDATNTTRQAEFELAVLESGNVPDRDNHARITRIVETNGTPADLNDIVAWGFEVFQGDDVPLIWDFDDVCLASHSAQDQAAKTDFVVRSSPLPSLLSLKTLDQAFGEGNLEEFNATVDLLGPILRSGEPTLQTAGRFYVSGLPCVQTRDVLYSEQRDPADPPLDSPPPGTPRSDAVYLDVWTDEVNYVDDPEIREVALGGPDTTTRSVVRHRVRVAHGATTAPAEAHFGRGSLTTGGDYDGAVNRLYRLEIDESGTLGDATFRWSDDNASTIQRVLQQVPQGSKTVTVEDASAFRPGDSIALATARAGEDHRISSITGNILELQTPTATAFDLDDRPRIQRWNAQRTTIPIDPDDSSFSPSLPLNDGVTVRFGGGRFVKGDYWTFTARHLPGDDRTGSADSMRIERLESERPRRIVHDLAPLAVLVRRGDRLIEIQDARRMIPGARTDPSRL